MMDLRLYEKKVDAFLKESKVPDKYRTAARNRIMMDLICMASEPIFEEMFAEMNPNEEGKSDE